MKIKMDIRVIKIQSCFCHESILQALFHISHFAFQENLIRDQRYIEFHETENRPIFKYHLGAQQIRYKFQNFTPYVNYNKE